jgi:hypothetical protein
LRYFECACRLPDASESAHVVSVRRRHTASHRKSVRRQDIAATPISPPSIICPTSPYQATDSLRHFVGQDFPTTSAPHCHTPPFCRCPSEVLPHGFFQSGVTINRGQGAWHGCPEYRVDDFAMDADGGKTRNSGSVVFKYLEEDAVAGKCQHDYAASSSNLSPRCRAFQPQHAKHQD